MELDRADERVTIEGLNLVKRHLKRTQDGGHMELQAIRYAAMVSSMTLDQAIEAEAQAQALCMLTNDFRRAYEAFTAIIKPVLTRLWAEVNAGR